MTEQHQKVLKQFVSMSFDERKETLLTILKDLQKIDDIFVSLTKTTENLLVAESDFLDDIYETVILIEEENAEKDKSNSLDAFIRMQDALTMLHEEEAKENKENDLDQELEESLNNL